MTLSPGEVVRLDLILSRTYHCPEEPLASEYEVLQVALVCLGERRDRLYRMVKVRQTNGHEIAFSHHLGWSAC